MRLETKKQQLRPGTSIKYPKGREMRQLDPLTRVASVVRPGCLPWLSYSWPWGWAFSSVGSILLPRRQLVLQMNTRCQGLPCSLSHWVSTAVWQVAAAEEEDSSVPNTESSSMSASLPHMQRIGKWPWWQVQLSISTVGWLSSCYVPHSALAAIICITNPLGHIWVWLL